MTHLKLVKFVSIGCRQKLQWRSANSNGSVETIWPKLSPSPEQPSP